MARGVWNAVWKIWFPPWHHRQAQAAIQHSSAARLPLHLNFSTNFIFVERCLSACVSILDDN